MTTSTTQSSNESLQIGPQSQNEAATTGEVIFGNFEIRPPLPLTNTVSLAQLGKDLEALPGMENEIALARTNLADELYGTERLTLTVFRLKSGYSQAKLAELVGTSQSHIARIELGQTDPGTDLVGRIAAALNFEESEIFQAIRTQRTHNEKPT